MLVLDMVNRILTDVEREKYLNNLYIGKTHNKIIELLNTEVLTPSQAFHSKFFLWDITVEGYDYWCDICDHVDFRDVKDHKPITPNKLIKRHIYS